MAGHHNQVRGPGGHPGLSRRRLLGGAVGAGAVLLGGGQLLAACGGDDDDDAGAATTIGGAATAGTAVGSTSATSGGGDLVPANLQLSWLHSVQFGGSYVAEEAGYYAANGLEITLTPGGPNAPVDPPVVQGTALAGISAADYAGKSVASGAPFKIVGVAMQKNPFVIASLSDAPITEPGQMVGKKLGMATINQPILDALATFNGFDASDVEVVPYQYDPAPLVNGEVDCIMCWLTDLPIAMTMAGVENTTMLLADFGYKVHSQTYIATIESIETKRDQILGLLRAEIKGWQDFKADPDAAAELTVARFPDLGLDLEAQKLQASKQLELMFSPLTDEKGFLYFDEASVEENVATLGELGVTVSPDVWDTSLLDEIFQDGPVLE